MGTHIATGRAALIVTGGSREGEDAFARARTLLQDAGVPLTSARLVGDARHLPDAVRAALATGTELLVIGGGDGTVNCAVDALLDRGAGGNVVLGVLPLGTANDFARTLGLPTELDDACAVIAAGHAVAVDVGRAGDAHYVNVASIGLSVAVTEALSPRLKRSLGALAYPVGAIRAFLRHRPFAATLRFPDGDHAQIAVARLLQVGVGNGRFYGGGLVVASDAAIDSGLLDVYTIQVGRARDLLGVLHYLRTGDFITADCVRHYQTRAVRIETRPSLPLDIDGEVRGTTPVDIAVLRAAIKVLVPPDAEEEAPGLTG